MIKLKNEYLTSAQAADSYGCTPDHIRKMIGRGKLVAEKFGHTWMIEKRELLKIKRQRFPRIKEINLDGRDQ